MWVSGMLRLSSIFTLDTEKIQSTSRLELAIFDLIQKICTKTMSLKKIPLYKILRKSLDILQSNKADLVWPVIQQTLNLQVFFFWSKLQSEQSTVRKVIRPASRHNSSLFPWKPLLFSSVHLFYPTQFKSRLLCVVFLWKLLAFVSLSLK